MCRWCVSLLRLRFLFFCHESHCGCKMTAGLHITLAPCHLRGSLGRLALYCDWSVPGRRSLLLRFSAGPMSASLPAQLRVQAWLQGEGVPWACWVVAKAVGLRSEALQRRCGVSLEAQREMRAAEVFSFSKVMFVVWTSARYLQEGRLHGGVVDPTQGSWGGGGREGRHPRER